MEVNKVNFQKYLAYFGSTHLDFRKNELIAIADMEGIPFRFYGEADMKLTPFAIIEVPNDEDVKKIASRSVTLKGIFEIWGHGKNYEECIEDVKKFVIKNVEYVSNCTNEKSSFRYTVDSFGKKLSRESQVEIMNKFLFLGLKGPVEFKTPDVSFWILEDVGEHGGDIPPKDVYYCRELCETGRDLILKYTLKKRLYLGTTSMDAELSLISANQARIQQGHLMMDPFVGTGSFLVACAHYGAVTMGGDIDIRVLRGKEEGKSVFHNMEQYNLTSYFEDVIRFDYAQKNLWRPRPLFDAIVTDPPYGIRAGARKVGFKNNEEKHIIDDFENHEGYHRHICQTVPYSVSEVLNDMFSFSALHLVNGGYLVFWLPTTSDYKDADLPDHPCFTLLSNSLQQLSSKWGRRLITMKKTTDYDQSVHGNWVSKYDAFAGHANFPAKIFNDDSGARDDFRHLKKKKTDSQEVKEETL